MFIIDKTSPTRDYILIANFIGMTLLLFSTFVFDSINGYTFLPQRCMIKIIIMIWNYLRIN